MNFIGKKHSFGGRKSIKISMNIYFLPPKIIILESKANVVFFNF